MSSRDHLIKVLEAASVVADKRGWTEREGFVYRLMRQRLLARLAWAIAFDEPIDRLAPEWYGAGAFLVARIERGERATTVLIFSADPDGEGPFEPGGGGVTCSEGVKRGMLLLSKDGRGWLMEQIDGEPIFDGDDNDLLDRVKDRDGIYLIKSAKNKLSMIEWAISFRQSEVLALHDDGHSSHDFGAAMLEHEMIRMLAIGIAGSSVLIKAFEQLPSAAAGNHRKKTSHSFAPKSALALCANTGLSFVEVAALPTPASLLSEDPSASSHPLHIGLGPAFGAVPGPLGVGLGHTFGATPHGMGSRGARGWSPPFRH